MLSLPAKSRRKKQPYLAIRARLLKRQVSKQAPLFLTEVLAFISAKGIQGYGPAFFRYNAVDSDGELDMEFGYFTEKLHPGSGPIRSGILPSGSFLSVKWIGPYTRLPDVQQMLNGWILVSKAAVDRDVTEESTSYACRMEIFHIGPPIEPDPDKWLTETAVMLKPASHSDD